MTLKDTDDMRATRGPAGQETEMWAFAYHEDGAYSRVGTREEAIAEGRRECGDDSFFIGKVVEADLVRIATLTMSNIIDRARDVVAEDELGGDFADSWLENVSKEDEDALESLLIGTFVKWCVDHKHEPDWFMFEASEIIGPAKPAEGGTPSSLESEEN